MTLRSLRFVLLLALGAWPLLAADDPGPARSDTLSGLLDPAALRATRTPRTLAELRASFADPPAEFRPAPLWVWNDELDWPRLEEQLRQFAARGTGGVFVHPRPGLMTEYLGDEWFSLWKRSLALGKELGLEVHIYDENSYPSGFSGGHVPSLAPDTAGRVLLYEWRESTDGVPWMDKATVAVYAVEKREDGAPRAYRRIVQGDTASAGERVLVTRIAPVPAAEWTAGFPYVDLTDPRTTEVFLQTTYERYRREVGDEFGRTVLWAFSDEPELSKSQGWDGPGLPLSLRTLAEFRKRRGYDLADHLPSLHWDAGDFRRLRFDYWETIHELLAEAFFQPMFAWCDRNRLQWTGHWWEHLWPEPWSTPSDMSMNAFQHVPGIDLLAFQTDGLRAHGVEPHMLLTVKQVASVAHQLGRPRVLSETYGGGGWGLGLEDMKRLGDWEIVHGINLVIPHLAHATVRGPRKRDWPQSFSDAAEWWKDYRVHADHVGRLSLAMASGRAVSRTLVLNPSTAAYLVARRSEASGANPDLERIKASQGELLQRLADHQVDFDLGDEYLLDWFGGVEGPRLRVGRALYDVVVWPAGMDNLRQATLDRLSVYARNGGAIVGLGEPATVLVDGRPSEAARALVARVARVATGEELLGVLHRLAPPRVRFETEVPPGVGFAERELDGGDRLLLFNNAGQEPVETVAVLQGTGRVEAWDTVSGAVDTYPVLAKGAGEVRLPLSLPPAGSLLLALERGGTPEVRRPEPKRSGAVVEARWTAAAISPNVLVLDFCDVSVGGREMKDVLAMQASRAVFREHGFDADPWEMAVQFRRGVLDRNTFGPGTGFAARYLFHVRDAEAARGLRLAVENPELYRVSLNGRPVDFTTGERWLDPHLRPADVASAVTVGDNTIEVVASPFDVRMAIEPVYLLGAFGLRAAGKGFDLVAPATLGIGPWRAQGRPFESASVVYTAEVTLPPGTAALRVALGRWGGALAEVRVDEQRAAVLAWPPWSTEVEATPGRHVVTVRVAGTPRNVFGPFHDPRPEPRVEWPGHWLLFAERKQPPGAEYGVAEYGLFEPPTLTAVGS